MEKKIVVLGAGFAGILTAKKLAKRFKKQDDVKITLIDKHPYHTMLTELHEVAANRVSEDHIRISLNRIFSGRRVDVRIDTIGSVDYDKKLLTGKVGTYAYDYLVIATGSKPTYFGTPGAEEFSLKLWSYDDAIKLKNHILDNFKKAVSETDPEERRKLLTFYIVGAGFTGVETTGEIAEWMPILCDQFEIPREDVRIVEVDMLDRVVPTFPEKDSPKVERRLRKMGVDVVLKTGVVGVGEDFIDLKQGETVSRQKAGTIVWTAGVEGSEFVQGAEALKHAGRGRLQTDAYLRSEGRTDVYVAGDNVFYIPEGQKAPVPQMVENAEQCADTIAHNLVVAVNGSGEMEAYHPSFHGAMLSVGGRYGAAIVGTDKTKISLASFFAMFVKHMIYIIYFIQILGWNKVWSYVYHEFFTIRNRRSFVGGYFSNRTPSFLLVPLRLFYGAFWVYEGIQKITEGWFQSPKLADYFKGASDAFNSIVNAAAAGAAAAGDATSSATQAASSTAAAATAAAAATTSATQAASGAASGAAAAAAPAGQLLLNWNIFNFFHVMVINTSDVAIKIQCSLMDWFNSIFLLRTTGEQMFFQYLVVLSEIAIGLLLIGGLFTFLASGYSLLLMALFLMTTGMYMSQWWMFFAGFALLIGAGRTFGLDYYVMPWLKKHWKNVGWVRKLYIYND